METQAQISPWLAQVRTIRTELIQQDQIHEASCEQLNGLPDMKKMHQLASELWPVNQPAKRVAKLKLKLKVLGEKIMAEHGPLVRARNAARERAEALREQLWRLKASEDMDDDEPL